MQSILDMIFAAFAEHNDSPEGAMVVIGYPDEMVNGHDLTHPPTWPIPIAEAAPRLAELGSSDRHYRNYKPTTPGGYVHGITPIYVWTAARVYFVAYSTDYNGYEVFSVPRYPVECVAAIVTP